MRAREYRTIKRTDMWAEGKWLDLWSVVHFLTGISIGFGLYILHFRGFPTFAFTLMLLIAYEMWEALVHIEETPKSREIKL